jgi:Fic family protein
VVDTPRWEALAHLLTCNNEVPAVIESAIVHGELLAMKPFAAGNGVVARAAARLTLAARGLDPQLVAVVEQAHWERQPEYRGAFGAYTTGTPDGVRAWFKHCCRAVERGAEISEELCAAET